MRNIILKRFAMSKLVAMRQRIKAIETIKKVTHAMRLISMSTRSRLRIRKANLDHYIQELITLLQRMIGQHPTWSQRILAPKDSPKRPLIIIIGSQKGLCGNFNTHLLSFFQQHVPPHMRDMYHSIIVGKKIVDSPQFQFGTSVMKFSEFTQLKLQSIAQKIADHIWHAQIPYTSVALFYNTPKTFFVQKPTLFNLIPFDIEHIIQAPKISLAEPYYWEQDPSFIIDFVAHKLIQSTVHNILLDSLIAEQAARFIAMDNSTRNAANLLTVMKMDYNKIRQAKITREITDLVANL